MSVPVPAGEPNRVVRQSLDFFHDDLLPPGGVGLTGEPGDRPQVYWMRVRHHDDLLGRVCAWLSPGSFMTSLHESGGAGRQAASRRAVRYSEDEV